MSKAGKGDGVDAGAVGSQHPVPEDIPHLSSPVSSPNSMSMLHAHQHHTSMQAGSPVKESSFLTRETSAEEVEGKNNIGAAEDRPAQEQIPSPAGPGDNSLDEISLRR